MKGIFMNPFLKNFFKEITLNKELQKKLYVTKNVSDVAFIANELGFKITPTDVLKAQASRLIELAASKPEEARIATAGKKPHIGAQWGREGTGFLECSGFWFLQLHAWGYSIQSFNQNITLLFNAINTNNELKYSIHNCKTIDELSEQARKHNFELSSIELLVYQALTILSLPEYNADLVARGSMFN